MVKSKKLKTTAKSYKKEVTQNYFKNAVNEVDIKNVKRGQEFWLAKIPSSLKEQWMKEPNGQTLGYIEVGGQGTKLESRCDVSLNPRRPEYEMVKFDVKQADTPPLYITAVDDNERVSLHGSVSKKLIISTNDMNYLTSAIGKSKKMVPKIGRIREIVGIDKKREKNTLQNDNQTAKMDFHGGDVSKYAENKTRKKERNVKMDRTLLRSKLFGLFAKKRYYSLDEINVVVKQPVQYLKAILSEICRYEERGEYRQKYSLKNEYKSSEQLKLEEEEEEQKRIQEEEERRAKELENKMKEE